MAEERPLVVVIAGPNGAGKSTTAPRLLQGPLGVAEFVNADTIARGMSAFHPESVAVAAGRVMLARLRALAEAREHFAFETTLAGRNFAPWLTGLRASGYWVDLAFVSLPDPEMAVERVQARTRSGGHNVEPEVVRRRFQRGLGNFFNLYRLLVDSWQIYDNSTMTELRLVASGEPLRVRYEAVWENLLRRAQ